MKFVYQVETLCQPEIIGFYEKGVQRITEYITLSSTDFRIRWKSQNAGSVHSNIFHPNLATDENF